MLGLKKLTQRGGVTCSGLAVEGQQYVAQLLSHARISLVHHLCVLIMFLLSLLFLAFLLLQSLHYPSLQVFNFLVLFPTPLVQSLQLKKFFGATLLSLEGFAHAVRDRTLVEGLVRLDGHFDFIAHAHQQKAPLRTIYCHLAN